MLCVMYMPPFLLHTPSSALIYPLPVPLAACRAEGNKKEASPQLLRPRALKMVFVQWRQGTAPINLSLMPSLQLDAGWQLAKGLACLLSLVFFPRTEVSVGSTARSFSAVARAVVCCLKHCTEEQQPSMCQRRWLSPPAEAMAIAQEGDSAEVRGRTGLLVISSGTAW